MLSRSSTVSAAGGAVGDGRCGSRAGCVSSSSGSRRRCPCRPASCVRPSAPRRCPARSRTARRRPGGSASNRRRRSRRGSCAPAPRAAGRPPGSFSDDHLVDVFVQRRGRDQLDVRLRLDHVDRRPHRPAVGGDVDRGAAASARTRSPCRRARRTAAPRRARRRRPSPSVRAAPAPAPAPWGGSARSRRRPAARVAAPRRPASDGRWTAAAARGSSLRPSSAGCGRRR